MHLNAFIIESVSVFKLQQQQREQINPTTTAELLFRVKVLHQSVGAGLQLTSIAMVTKEGG